MSCQQCNAQSEMDHRHDPSDNGRASLAKKHHRALLVSHNMSMGLQLPETVYLQSSMAPPGIFSILTYFLMSISLWPPLTSDTTHVTASSASSYRQQLSLCPMLQHDRNSIIPDQRSNSTRQTRCAYEARTMVEQDDEGNWFATVM